jgi:proton-dependent oligopeptide transporter, POT family
MDTNIAAPVQKIKHPKELYRLSLVLFWDRFGYYGIIALLIAYMVSQLHFEQMKGYAIFGSFAALSYGLPLFGGVIADRILGKRRSLIWGGLLHFIGLSCIALPYQHSFFIGLSIYVTGSGFFGGNAKALLGDFYHPGDTKGKDAGFTIWYGLFNLGVGLGAIVCGYIGQEINWHLGFSVAAFGALLSLLSMMFGINKKYGQPLDIAKIKQKVIAGISSEMLVYVLTLPVITLIILIFSRPSIMDVVLFPLTVISFIYIIFRAFSFTKTIRLKIFAALISFLVWILFLALYEQSSGSFNLFVLHNMDFRIGSVTLPGLAINNFLPGFLPAIMMPLMIFIWRKLSLYEREPGTIMKFIIGFLFMTAFFGLFWWGCRLFSGTGLVPVYFLFGGYVLMEFSELCIGPILYSLTYKLSPKSIVSTMMGVLGIAASSGEYLASKIGSLTAVPSNITDPVRSLPYFTKIYGELAVLSIGVAVFFILLLPVFKKLMQDVH